MAFYFAYGSNMSGARMRERVPEAQPLGPAELTGMRFVCNKLGVDGTAKANLEPTPNGGVWGVLWSLPDAGFPGLDRFERGYERLSVEVRRDGSWTHAVTYVSRHVAEDLRPSAEYKLLITEGAREHELPPSYQAQLEALESR